MVTQRTSEGARVVVTLTQTLNVNLSGHRGGHVGGYCFAFVMTFPCELDAGEVHVGGLTFMSRFVPAGSAFPKSTMQLISSSAVCPRTPGPDASTIRYGRLPQLRSLTHHALANTVKDV